MAGYLNRFIHLDFPELAGVDEQNRAYVWVKIRNPRLIPSGELAGMADKFRITDDGAVEVGGDKAADAVFTQFAGLILAGNVWDCTWLPEDLDSDDPGPLLPMPPSAADLRKMPMEIFNRIGDEVKKANPR